MSFETIQSSLNFSLICDDLSEFNSFNGTCYGRISEKFEATVDSESLPNVTFCMAAKLQNIQLNQYKLEVKVSNSIHQSVSYQNIK